MAAAEPQLTSRKWVVPAITAAGLMAACGEATTDPQMPKSQPTRRVPSEVERQVHRTFHRFERYCNSSTAQAAVLDRTTSDFIGWYRTYPAEQYTVQIDDEPGTMLSAILVLRYELSRCSPKHAARIDAVLPRKMLRGLRPLPESAR